MDAFELKEQKQNKKRQMMYFFSKVLKAIVYIVKMIIEVILGVIKTVLQAFKIPIPKV